jgi:hypothetical protein
MQMGRRTDGQRDMTELIVALRNFTNACKNSQDGAEFDCRKPEYERIGDRDERSQREIEENTKTNTARCVMLFSLSLSFSISLSLSLSLFLTTVELRAVRFSTRSSDYHCIRFSTALSTCNMQTYVEILFFIIIFVSFTE